MVLADGEELQAELVGQDAFFDDISNDSVLGYQRVFRANRLVTEGDEAEFY